MYILLYLLVFFGYWISVKKSILRGNFSFVSLGLVVDTVDQCFRVGSLEHGFGKRDRFVELGRFIVASVTSSGSVGWQDLAKFAGRAIAFSLAVPFMRHFLSVQYSVLTGREVRWTDKSVSNLLVRAISQRRGDQIDIVGGESVRGFLREVEACVALVLEDRKYPFFAEQHQSIVQVENDATLKQNGMLLELTDEAKAAGAKAPWGEDRTYEFGQLLPGTVFDIDMNDTNSGICEMTGLWMTFASINNTPWLLELFRNTRVSIGIDNFELVNSFNRGGVSGVGTLLKVQLITAMVYYMWSWNCIFHVYHVPGVDNRAE